MIYRMAADCIVVLHFMYVVFAVGGEVAIVLGIFLRWRWIRNLYFRCAHLLAVVVVAVEAIAGVFCPLTTWEYNLRRKAGQPVDQELGFIARIVHRLIFYDFPDWVFTATYVAFSAIVVATLLLVPPSRRPSQLPRLP